MHFSSLVLSPSATERRQICGDFLFVFGSCSPKHNNVALAYFLLHSHSCIRHSHCCIWDLQCHCFSEACFADDSLNLFSFWLIRILPLCIWQILLQLEYSYKRTQRGKSSHSEKLFCSLQPILSSNLHSFVRMHTSNHSHVNHSHVHSRLQLPLC